MFRIRVLTKGAAAVAGAWLATSLLVTPAEAHADEVCANAWLVRRDGSREYLAGPTGVCQESGWAWWFDLGTEPTTTLAPGPYKGAGFQVTVTFPL